MHFRSDSRPESDIATAAPTSLPDRGCDGPYNVSIFENVLGGAARMRRTAGTQRAARRRARGAWALLTTVGGAWLCGLVFFLAARGTVTATVARRDAPPADQHNLASFRFGVEVTASSYHKDLFSQHHPLFLLDGRARPTRLEKWASDKGDRNPWIAIRWREPRTLARVSLVHAGQFEADDLSIRDYTIACLRADGVGDRDGVGVGLVVGPSLKITGNTGKTAVHELPCTGAIGIRVHVTAAGADGVSRLYETRLR